MVTVLALGGFQTNRGNLSVGLSIFFAYLVSPLVEFLQRPSMSDEW